MFHILSLTLCVLLKRHPICGLNSACAIEPSAFTTSKWEWKFFVLVDIEEENEYVIGDPYLKSFDSAIYGSRGVFYDDV